jgi:hypothetical protein
MSHPKPGDLDLLGWHGPALFIAEAKSRAAEFTRQLVESTVRIAGHVGADLLYLCCPEPIDEMTFAAAQVLGEAHKVRVETMAGPGLVI